MGLLDMHWQIDSKVSCLWWSLLMTTYENEFYKIWQLFKSTITELSKIITKNYYIYKIL